MSERTDAEKLQLLLTKWQQQPDVMLPCAGTWTTGDVVRWIRASAVAEPPTARQTCANCGQREACDDDCPNAPDPAPAAPVPASVGKDDQQTAFDAAWAKRPSETESRTDKDRAWFWWQCATASFPAPSEAAPSPIMRAAAKAAKTVEGWSASKRDYADRVTGTSMEAAQEKIAFAICEEICVQLDRGVDESRKLAACVAASNRVREALIASLPAPAAAPTREEIIEQCAKVCDRWIRSKNLHESLAAAGIAKDILALKAAPQHQTETGR